MITAIEEPDDPEVQFPFPCPGYTPRGTLPGNQRYTCFLAERASDGQPVVLDFIEPAYTPPPSEQIEIESRLQKIRGLQHPGILRLSDLERPNDRYVLVHEDEPMQSLPDYIAQHGHPPLAEAIEMLTKLTDALAYAWRRKNLAHQELTPATIVMDRQSQPRIRDLGLAEIFPMPDASGRIDPRNDMRDMAAVFRLLVHKEGALPEDLPPHIAATIGRMEADELHKRPADWEEVCESLRTPDNASAKRTTEVSKEWHAPLYRPQQGVRLVKSTRGRLVLAGGIILTAILAVFLIQGADIKQNRHARGQLEDALAFRQNQPDKYNDLIDQYTRILDRDIDKQLRVEVDAHLAEAVDARNQVIYGILSKLDQTAAQAIQISDFGAAAHAYNIYDGPHSVESQPHRANRVRLIERMTSQAPNGIKVNPDQDPIQILHDMTGVNAAELSPLEPTMRLQLAQRVLIWQDLYQGLLRFVASSSPYQPDLVEKAERDLKIFKESHQIPKDVADNPPILNAIHAWGRKKRQEIQRQVRALSRYYSQNQKGTEIQPPKKRTGTR